MPWRIQKSYRSCKGYAVVKIADGSIAGCHDSREKAIRQQRALYANEGVAYRDDRSMSYPLGGIMNPGSVSTSGSTSASLVPVWSNGLTTITITDNDAEVLRAVRWEGILSFEGAETGDGRYFAEDAWSWREPPLTLMAQIVNEEGHKGAEVAGRIDRIWKTKRPDLGEGVSAVMGEGEFDSGDFGREISRLVYEETLRGISVDFGVSEAGLRDPETGEMVDPGDLELADILFGDYQQAALKAEILAATIVPTPAFADAAIAVVTASGEVIDMNSQIWTTTETDKLWYYFGPNGMVASGAAAPLKPPRKWFENPALHGPTPLAITDEGRIYGHLALWDSCHTGFMNVCKAPPRSPTSYAYFNVGELETDDGERVACGKLMYCREGGKHAPLEYSAGQASKHYDDSTKVGGFVRAGEDQYGIWLAGATKHNLTDEELQHLRQNPPSGDWRPVNRGTSELIAAFSVPVGGFPIPRSELRLVASAEKEEIAALILSPPAFEPRKLSRGSMRKLKSLVASAMPNQLTEGELEAAAELDGLQFSAEERRRMARRGIALPDGSFPIPDCDHAEKAIRAQGRAPAGKRSAVRTHIRKRVRSLGCSGDIYDKYK